MRRLVLEIRGAGVRYRQPRTWRHRSQRWALREVNLELYHGESLALVGGNGAGKSTLLKLIAGIFAPDRGRVINHGVSVSLLALQLGFIPYLSGRDNIFLSGLLLGLRYKEIARRLESIVEFAELAHCIDDPVRTYSTGMQMRLGFSIAIQIEPDVLLVDEVLGVGDAAFHRKSSQALREKILAHDKTVVLVSHQKETIKELCNRAAWMDQGTIRAAGPVDEILALYEANGGTPS